MAQIERWLENFRRVGLKKRKLGKLYANSMCTVLISCTAQRFHKSSSQPLHHAQGRWAAIPCIHHIILH